MGKRIRTIAVSTAVTLAALVGPQAQPAQAAVEVPDSGAIVFEGTFARVLLHVARPDGSCLAMPATAGSIAGQAGVAGVTAYTSANCAGYPTNLGTLRTFDPGRFQSFRAFSL